MATAAIIVTVSTPSHGADDAQSPRATATAKHTATTPRYAPRFRYGRPLPYSEVNPPIVAINPAVVSPASQPTRTGTAMQIPARSANGHRRGTLLITKMFRSGLVAVGAGRSDMSTACSAFR